MEKLSGLVLDINDDAGGETLRRIYPSPDFAPESVKLAHRLSHEELSALPDDVFGLVLHDGEVTLRKFACIDEGNTRLHVEYLLQNTHKLPEEAVKVAAQNLLTACEWYSIEAPEALSKLADVINGYDAAAAALPVASAALEHFQSPALRNAGIDPRAANWALSLGGRALLGGAEAHSLGENAFEGARNATWDSTLGSGLGGFGGSILGPSGQLVGQAVGSGAGYSAGMSRMRNKAKRSARHPGEAKEAEDTAKLAAANVEHLHKLAMLGALGTAANVGMAAMQVPGAIGEAKQRHATAAASGSVINPGVLATHGR